MVDDFMKAFGIIILLLFYLFIYLFIFCGFTAVSRPSHGAKGVVRLPLNNSKRSC